MRATAPAPTPSQNEPQYLTTTEAYGYACTQGWALSLRTFREKKTEWNQGEGDGSIFRELGLEPVKGKGQHTFMLLQPIDSPQNNP